VTEGFGKIAAGDIHRGHFVRAAPACAASGIRFRSGTALALAVIVGGPGNRARQAWPGRASPGRNRADQVLAV